MPDYQELYQMLFRATERAIQILIDAQRTCEEKYLMDTEQNDDAVISNRSKGEPSGLVHTADFRTRLMLGST